MTRTENDQGGLLAMALAIITFPLWLRAVAWLILMIDGQQVPARLILPW